MADPKKNWFFQAPNWPRAFLSLGRAGLADRVFALEIVVTRELQGVLRVIGFLRRGARLFPARSRQDASRGATSRIY